MSMVSKKFDLKKIDKLNDPSRLQRENPDLIWQTLALEKPQVLIDIGAGTGFFASRFSWMLDCGKVYACDIEKTMIDWMTEHLPEVGEGTVVPVLMTECEVPLAEGIADLVYMVNLHHELEDPDAIVGEAFRLLKKGGKLAIVDWKTEETPGGPPLEIRVAAETIRAQMAAGGFTDILTHTGLPCHCFLEGRKG
jgi:ubiquinone/menaquinone biosynthesis C-methylase UbiE